MSGVRFDRDDEVDSSLHGFLDDDKNLTKLIGRMRQVGVLGGVLGGNLRSGRTASISSLP